jgi:hypothetical protein
VGKAPNGTKGKSGVHAEIHRLVKLRLVDIYRTIDRDPARIGCSAGWIL